MAFELTVARLARRADKTPVSLLIRIVWNTVGNIISRVKDYLELDSTVRFDDLKNIGMDETSYKKGYKYIITVVNPDNSSVIWVGIGHGYNVLKKFFKLLNDDRRKSIETISGDGAKRIDKCRDEFISQATRGLDPFHVVEWAQDVLDLVRRAEWSAANKELKEAKKSQKKRHIGRPKKVRKILLKARKRLSSNSRIADTH